MIFMSMPTYAAHPNEPSTHYGARSCAVLGDNPPSDWQSLPWAGEVTPRLQLFTGPFRLTRLDLLRKGLVEQASVGTWNTFSKKFFIIVEFSKSSWFS